MNFTKITKIAALCTLPLILTACGGDDGGSSSNTEAWFKSAPTELEGTWKSDCILEEGDYTINTEIYTGNKVSGITTTYSDPQCQNEDSKTLMTAQLKVGNSVGTEYIEVDAIIKSIKASLSNQEFVTEANEQNFLGFSNWKINVFKNVKDSPEFTEDSMKDIIKIDGNKLYFGDDTQGLVNGRPTIIDYSQPEIKQ